MRWDQDELVILLPSKGCRPVADTIDAMDLPWD